MPYIKSTFHRKLLDEIINDNLDLFAETGNLNYFLYKLSQRLCKRYKNWRDILGELEAAKLEIYRRQTAPYEDKKIEENGDIF